MRSVEALEYPMRVERYELTRGSSGVVRAVRVLEPATVSLLTDRRRPPAGARGSEPGAVDCNLLGEGPDQQELPPKTTRLLAAGEVVTVVTRAAAGAHPHPGLTGTSASSAPTCTSATAMSVQGDRSRPCCTGTRTPATGSSTPGGQRRTTSANA